MFSAVIRYHYIRKLISVAFKNIRNGRYSFCIIIANYYHYKAIDK